MIFVRRVFLCSPLERGFGRHIVTTPPQGHTPAPRNAFPQFRKARAPEPISEFTEEDVCWLPRKVADMLGKMYDVSNFVPGVPFGDIRGVQGAESASFTMA